MLGFLMNAAVDAVVNGSVSTIVSYQSGALHVDLNLLKDYVDAKVDSFIAKRS